LTPTFRDVNKKYSTRYYLSLVLIDEGEQRDSPLRSSTLVFPSFYIQGRRPAGLQLLLPTCNGWFCQLLKVGSSYPFVIGLAFAEPKPSFPGRCPAGSAFPARRCSFNSRRQLNWPGATATGRRAGMGVDDGPGLFPTAAPTLAGPVALRRRPPGAWSRCPVSACLKPEPQHHFREPPRSSLC